MRIERGGEGVYDSIPPGGIGAVFSPSLPPSFFGCLLPCLLLLSASSTSSLLFRGLFKARGNFMAGFIPRIPYLKRGRKMQKRRSFGGEVKKVTALWPI